MLPVLLFTAGPATSMVLYDFEQAYYIDAFENQCKDHAVVWEDSLYHCYYIESLPQEPGEYNRTERWLRHLTSPDRGPGRG